MKKLFLLAPVICVCANPTFAANDETGVKYNNQQYDTRQNYSNSGNDYNYESRFERPKVNYNDLYIDPNEYKTENEVKPKDEDDSVQGYIGVGLLGQAVNETLKVNDRELASADLSSWGINFNGGIKARYIRFGLDISSTIGRAELSSQYLDYDYSVSDINMVRYSIELAGIIKCSRTFDLEIGGTVGRGRYKIDGNWSEWLTPYGLLLGGTINFNAHHALTIMLKGYRYSLDTEAYGYTYKTNGAMGEFVVGYRYSF